MRRYLYGNCQESTAEVDRDPVYAALSVASCTLLWITKLNALFLNDEIEKHLQEDEKCQRKMTISRRGGAGRGRLTSCSCPGSPAAQRGVDWPFLHTSSAENTKSFGDRAEEFGGA